MWPTTLYCPCYPQCESYHKIKGENLRISWSRFIFWLPCTPSSTLCMYIHGDDARWFQVAETRQHFHEFFNSSFSKFTWFPFPIITSALFSKCVKMLQPLCISINCQFHEFFKSNFGRVFYIKNTVRRRQAVNRRVHGARRGGGDLISTWLPCTFCTYVTVHVALHSGWLAVLEIPTCP